MHIVFEKSGSGCRALETHCFGFRGVRVDQKHTRVVPVVLSSGGTIGESCLMGCWAVLE